MFITELVLGMCNRCERSEGQVAVFTDHLTCVLLQSENWIVVLCKQKQDEGLCRETYALYCAIECRHLCM